MGKKIFVSYKYSDSFVLSLPGVDQTTARSYVDEIQDFLSEEDHIYKGENDGESLKDFKDDTIASKLKGKIYDSSVTIVLISKGMKEYLVSEDDQWIPWEISYSLKELTRDGRTSKTNAVLAVVLPDEIGSYDYFITYDHFCNCINFNTPFLFSILKNNMFNIKTPNTTLCNGSHVYYGHFSYISCVKWEDFKLDITKYINVALEIKANQDDYNVIKSV